MNIELLIQHGNQIYMPAVQEGITWYTERKNSPGQLDFKILADNKLSISEGDVVRLKVDSDNIFYGFVFKLSRDKENIINVRSYDQLRYLKNKDTYVYENRTASELIKMIADDFNLQTGTLDDTKFKIASRVEANISLFDIIGNALDVTLDNTKNLYVLYDDFGKLTLKNIENTRLNLLIDEEIAENFEYSSSIDDKTYNKIKLAYDNEETGKRDVYISQSSDNINRWGVLQYYDTIQKEESGQAKADALLELYNSSTKNLTLKNVLGDNRVRAGSMIAIRLKLGEAHINNMMLVEKCKHEYKESEHYMTLTLRGGDINV